MELMAGDAVLDFALAGDDITDELVVENSL